VLYALTVAREGGVIEAAARAPEGPRPLPGGQMRRTSVGISDSRRWRGQRARELRALLRGRAYEQSAQARTAVTDGLPRRVPLPALVQTLWSIFGMDSFVRFSLEQYPQEKMLAFRIVGIGDVVSVRDPELLREVFTGDSEILRGGEANAEALQMLGPNSVLLLDGESHLSARRLLIPPFHGEAISHYAQAIEQITMAEVDRWPVGREFTLWPRMRAIAMEVILRAVIGVRDDARRRRLGELLPSFTRGGVFAALGQTRLPWLTDSGAAKRLPWVRARAEAEGLVFAEITDHRSDPEGRDDILAMLVATRDGDGRALSDQELFDHCLTLMGAGQETTAAALAWCFERVLRHPDVLSRCRESEPGEYLTAVVSETLRTRPVIDSTARKLAAPLELGGYRLPSGTVIAASIGAIQQSPRLYPEPSRFRPERFLERPAPYTFIPFGGGDRRCIGASFAMMEMKTVLRTVLGRIDMRLINRRDERPSRLRSIAIVPANGVRVIASTRHVS
jgi:cytochrome P450 family 135